MSSQNSKLTLGDKIDLLESKFNEVAFGYDDSGCFWRFQYGSRGCGSMMSNFGTVWCSEPVETFEEAVDSFLIHLGIGSTPDNTF